MATYTESFVHNSLIDPMGGALDSSQGAATGPIVKVAEVLYDGGNTELYAKQLLGALGVKQIHLPEANGEASDDVAKKMQREAQERSRRQGRPPNETDTGTRDRNRSN